MRLLYALMVAIAASPVLAEPKDEVIEVPIGERFSLPQCVLFSTKYGLGYEDPWPSYDLDSKQPTLPCWKLTLGSPSKPGLPLAFKGREIVGIAHEQERMPAGIREQIVELSDGVVRRVILHTAGVQWQREVFDLLVIKYGQPTSKRIVSKSNLMGAKIQAIEAQWAQPGVSVRFEGVTDNVGWGQVEVLATRIPASPHVRKEPQL